MRPPLPGPSPGGGRTRTHITVIRLRYLAALSLAFIAGGACALWGVRSAFRQAVDHLLEAGR